MKDEAKVLAGKVAIVTGGSGAIGRAILGAFEHAGARAVSLDLSEPGDKRAWVKCDVREENSVLAAIQSVYKEQGRIDFVVHVAGISRDSVLGSFLEPADVAASVMFLCGPGAARVTGQILRVDGGQFLGGA